MPNFWTGFWSGLIAGIVAGFFANWGYAMLMRLLPATLSRYPVRIGKAELKKGLAGVEASAEIKLGPPGKSRAIMEPLVEDLKIRIRLDDQDWIDGVWSGNNEEVHYTVNRTTKAYAVLLETGNNGIPVYLSNKYGENDYLIKQDGTYKVVMQILRVIDDKVADTKTFSLIIRGSKLESIL